MEQITSRNSASHADAALSQAVRTEIAQIQVDRRIVIVAASTLLHLPSGEVRSLGPDADAKSPAIFTPDGDIIAGSANGTLTRYCRRD